MAKECSAVKGFVPGYGTIIVVPEERSRITETVVLQTGVQKLPRGRVVAIGKVPRRHRKVPIGIGSLIAYSKIVTQSVPVEIDGILTDVMCVMWPDYRMCWIDEKKDHETFTIRDIFAFSAGFATGIAFSYQKHLVPIVKGFRIIVRKIKGGSKG